MNTRPNILFINLDQLRYDSLGFTGHPFVKTPNIDKLASGGIQFDSAYTPLPSCCPSRQCLITGVMPEQHGGMWNYGGGGSLPIPSIDPNRDMWLRLLQGAGYRTAYFGKWHVHPDLDPTAFGFDSFEDPPNDNYETPHKAVKHVIENNPWPEFPIGYYETLPFEECHTHVLARDCIETIKTLSDDGAPWHIRLDFSEPHLPCVPAEPFASMYPPETIPPWENFDESFDGKPYIQKQQLRNWKLEDWSWKEWSVYLSGYLGIISQVDDAIGRVVETLENHDLRKDTLIIFTTDHGDAAGSHRQIDKHYVMYEEETHVPLVLNWDGVINPNTTCNDFLSHFLDLPVTLLDLLELPVPRSFQGRSFLPQLCGKKAKNPRRFAFSTYNGQQFGLFCQRMIRDQNYKYVWNATDVDECYDLVKDPFEMNNLAAENEDSELCRCYRRNLYEVFSDLNDPLVTGFWNKRYLTSQP
ncbi:MAG: sulfatase-like hydrolase/transferase [Verrucomicrobiota bacterium]